MIYKIRDKSTGLFSMGGSYPYFNKNGKIWKRKGDLIVHLGLVYKANAYTNCQIVAYEMTELEVIEINSIVNKIKENKMVKEIKERAKEENYKTQVRREQWEKLNKEFAK